MAQTLAEAQAELAAAQDALKPLDGSRWTTWTEDQKAARGTPDGREKAVERLDRAGQELGRLLNLHSRGEA